MTDRAVEIATRWLEITAEIERLADSVNHGPTNGDPTRAVHRIERLAAETHALRSELDGIEPTSTAGAVAMVAVVAAGPEISPMDAALLQRAAEYMAATARFVPSGAAGG